MENPFVLLEKYLMIFFLFVLLLLCDSASAAEINKIIYPNSGDGFIHTGYRPNYGEGVDWESIRSETSNFYFGYDSPGNTGVGIGATLDNEGMWSGLIKSVFPFDTSSIPEGAAISSAKLHIFTMTKENNGGYQFFDWNIYGAHPESTEKLVAADFLNIDSVPFSAAKNFDETADSGGENVFELNEQGISFINKGGLTSFGVRSEYYDVLNHEPVWTSYSAAIVRMFFSESIDQSKRPYLEVTYTVDDPDDLGESLKWLHKQELVIDNDKIAGNETLLDVPVLISGSSLDQSVFAAAKSDGCDIRFSKSGNQDDPEELPFEKVTYSADTKNAEFWVKRDLDPNKQNSIWIWWGNGDAKCYHKDDNYGAKNVWENNFKAVWHLSEKDGKRYDSTAYDNDLEVYNDVARNNGLWGGGASDFELDNSQYLEIKKDKQSSLDFDNTFTVMSWVKPESLDIAQVVYERGGDYTTDMQHRLLIHESNNFSGGYAGGNFGLLETKPITKEWQFLAATLTDGEQKTYYNGDVFGRSYYPVAVKHGNYDLGVGRRYFVDRPNYFDGLIDEVWLSDEVLSDAWVKTVYNNQSNPSTFIHPAPDEGLQPVILIPGTMGSFRKKGELRLDPILHTYDQLWDALLAAGYEDGKTLFAFPYEWRDSNVTNAEKLDIKIEEAKAAAGTRQVDIVAHSMGGIVSRAYVQGDAYDDDVDQIIFLGTPQRGAPLAYAMWQAGEFGKALEDKVLKRIFAHEAHAHGYEGDNDVYDYAHGRPIASLPELLPVYDYLQDQGQSDMRHYPDNYPANPLLSVLDQEESLARLDAVDTLEIIGDYENETWQSYIVGQSSKPGLWSYGMPVDYYDSYDGILRGAGDGTVPHESNPGFCDDSITLAVKHRKLPTAAREYVIEAFEQTPISLADGADYDRLLMVRIMSPADFLVIAPDGKTLGKDFSSNAVSEEIVSGYYSGFDTEVEFATIANPASGDYRIKLQGVADGDYTLIVSYLGDEIEVDREYKGTIKNGQLVEFVISLDEGSDSIGELLPWNGFERFRHDLEKKHAEDGVNEKVYKDLAKDINRLEAWYEKALVEKREWKQNLEFKLIRLHLEIMRANLKFYAHKKWISADAEVLLQGDITIIKNML